MKTSPLALAVFLLGAVGSDFTVDAADLSAATATSGDRSAPSPLAIYPTAIERLHGIVGQVERNLASRRLLINQDEAAKRVRDAVVAANQAVKNGETSGVALPLDYNVAPDGIHQLTMRLRLPGVDRDLNVLIDTGSSGLAFCDKSLINKAKNISKTKYAQCKEYGGDVTCPDSSTGLSFLASSGQIFRGDVSAYNDQGEEVASMDNVNFAIMELAQIDTCFGPQDGIFGVGYKGLNNAVELPSPDFNVSSLWNVSCTNPDQDAVSQGYKTIGNCDTGDMTQVYLNPPLEQSLGQDYNSGQIKAAAFGLYLDYAATIGSKVDMIVPSLGILFRGDLAYDNQFYNDGKVQVAKTVSPNNIGDLFKWYQLNFTSIRVPGLNLTQSTVDLCSQHSKCITDTGNGFIFLPLPQDDCDRFNKITSEDELKEAGSLFIDLAEDDITLSFPLLWLREQLGLSYVHCTGTEGDFALGLPITQYYYTVYDMGKDTVSFVELNLSNETQAFLYGPELGGVNGNGTTTTSPTTSQPTSKGCFCHTFGLSLLAWTVLVPTAIAVITSL
jgi:hypothetical protein